ncbi:E3 SUMO-protein ligase RanBP2-like isoform X2 [Stegodyphus dumicola]|uniref:E3 SUMO-protein ligase RanBP2-like isoform X2 n=1 Tax=Stegodyphus dumicola TaxID=202533 RepID=UPI0015B068A9|nr:E3 SUMO-protein ligase RanBP2-like isoform X2 [Stegodyphus dumicola]
MFRTKKDVDKHVTDVLNKICSENEKNLRGYTLARLYFQVKDYESAKKYLMGFLSVRDHHAASHKLLAQIYEETNNPENALQSYKRSLEIDPHQNDIVLKICELYCQLPVDHETARYWADRAEQLFPHNEIVFKLRECLVSAEGEPNHKELENLIATELAAQPKNIDLRIKLLRLYLDTERVKEAYEHATLIESQQLFPFSVDWYYLLGDIFEAYQEECGQDLDSQFYVHYLTALDHLILLTLAEPHSFVWENGKTTSSINDAAAVLLTFDQLLKIAVEKDIKEGSWLYFIHHMKGQLYYHMASLLLKRAKMDQGNRKEAFRFSAGLALVCYSFKPMNLLQEIWFTQMNENQKIYTSFFQQGALRTSFIGHVIVSMCKEDKSKWLQKIKQDVCLTQVKERIYSRVFSTVVQKEKLLSSYFILDSTFEQCSLEFPVKTALQEYDKSAYKLRADSLHHLVWLEAQRKSDTPVPADDIITEVFKNLQYGNKNLSQGSCESLCVLDLEAYLLATIYQAHYMMERKSSMLNSKNQDFQLSFPPDVTDPLCSKQQAAWWRTAYGLYTCSIKEKHGEHRRNLQHGLEVIRGIGNHGMEVQLVVHLARQFAQKSDLLMKNTEDSGKIKISPENVSSLRVRAIHYWNIALGMLDKIALGQTLRTPKDQVFIGCNKSLSSTEVKQLQEDGRLYLAVRMMDDDQLAEAAEMLSKLSSPYGSYYLALTLKKLASQEEAFSVTKTALLNKAKSALHETMDRIKDDQSHPLNKEIYIELEEVENELASDMNHSPCNNYEELDETDSYYETPSQSSHFLVDNSKSAMQSTPRPSSKFTTSKSKFQMSNRDCPRHFEPSPERLDAQIRALALNQDTLVKTFMQQQQAVLETNKSIAEALKQNNSVMEQLKKKLEELTLSKCQHRRPSKKSGFMKDRGDEEDDYNDYDPNSILEYYADEGGEDYRASGYSYDPTSRIVHDAAAPLNYVVSPAIPPGPPPALNHYNYQYPPHAVMPAPPPAVAERPPFYHPPPGQGLPFSEGQQLPQFHFHVASPIVKPPPPPVMSSVSSIPPATPTVTLPPPTVNLPPTQTVIPPPLSHPLPVPSPWSKAVSVPHAFQIPLPATAPFASSANLVPSTSSQIKPLSNVMPITSQSELKNLLGTPASGTASFGHALQLNTTVTSTSSSTIQVPSIFAGISKTPEISKVERSRCDSDNAGSPDIDGHDLEKEVMGDFKPLIPLPAEIVVETGEENEVVLFEDRAKLYRFVDQEWKERGIGTVKILHHEGSGRIRLLMRRDQVLKVCANHYITPNMEIHALKNSDKAWTWVAQDFADEELRPEHFCIRFKTADIAAAFKAAFEKALNIAKENEAKKVASPSIKSTTNASPVTQKPFGIKFLPKAGSWTCPTCYVSNAAEKLLCVACETKKPGSQVTSDSHSISVTTSTNNSTANQFTFGTNSLTITSISTPKNTFGGFTFSTNPMIQDTKTDIKDREILVVSTKSKNSPQVTKVTAPKPSPFSGFSFKSPPTIAVSSSSTVQSVESTESSTASAENNISKIHSMLQTITPDNVFGSKSTESVATFPSLSVSVSKSSEESTVPTSSVPLYVNVSAEGCRVSTDAADSAPEEFIPTAEFKPIVPLPALIDVKTGEEGEEKLFGERAKLFRFDPEGKEWKERGIGELKILFLKDSKKYRVLMRREQVLKICANHYILPDMKLTPLATNDKAWVWFAQDFSDGDLKKEQFAAKFKTKEIAQEFFEVFQKCQNDLKEIADKNEKPQIAKSQSDTCTGNKTAFDELFKPVASSWKCSKCQKSNMNESSCVYCSTPKSGISVVTGKSSLVSEQKPLSELFKPDKNSWECQACYVRNKSCDVKCVSCESPQPSSSDTFNKNAISNNQNTEPISYVKNGKSEPLTNSFKPPAGSWQCQSCLIQYNSDVDKCAACETKKPGTSFTSSAFPSSSDFGKFQFGSSVQSTSSTEKTSPFSFGSNKPSSGDFLFGMKPITQSTTFSFGLSSVIGKGSETVGFKPTLPTSNTPAVFGGTTQKSDLLEKKSIAIPQTTSAPTDAFGNTSSTSIFSFGSPAGKEADSSSVEFRFGSPQKYEFNFSGVRPRSPTKTPKSPKSPATPSDVDEDDEGDSFDADNIYFQPAIPLPPKVDVKTGEENEDVMFCKRAKLFRFSAGEWKERGVGDVKILFDKNLKKARLLMRRDQVLKVCLNHHLTKEIVFEWRGEKSLTWAATDFSENEASPELFAIRFKSSELAQEFKDALDDALKLNALASESEVSSEQTSTATKVITNFSFKSDSSVKTESPFSAGSLSACFGTTLQGKSLFGNSANVLGTTETKPSSSVSPFFQTDKLGTNSVFGQNVNFSTNSSKSIFGGHGLKFGLGSDALDKKKIDKDSEIEIVYEATASPDKITEAEKLKLPRNFYLYESKPPCKGCRGCTDTISYKDVSADVEKNSAPKFTELTQSTPQSENSGELFATSAKSVTFADLATDSSFESLAKPSSTKNAFAGAGTPLFSNPNNSTEDAGDDETVSQGPDIHFEPVIPLPELVDVKTGEEDETPVFIKRAKLFRFDSATKQWKERGVGDLKILKHKEKQKFRIILRRDQVHKIACNHFISEDMSLVPMATSETALCWNAIDYADGSPVASKFAVRFKNKDFLEEFREKFNECIELIKHTHKSTEASTEQKSEGKDVTESQVSNCTKQNAEKTEISQKTSNQLETQSNHVAPESENNEHNSDEESEEDDFIFEKRVSFEIFDESSNQFKPAGMGTLQMLYDDTVYGYRILMMDDKDNCLCENVIAIQTCLRVEGKKASWTAIDLSVEPPKRRQFRATFSSLEAVDEFNKQFAEGKELAVNSEIVEKSDDYLTATSGV